MKNQLLLVIGIILISTSCENPETKPGQFQIVRLDGLEKKPVEAWDTAESDAAYFDLGEIRTSRNFYFLLKNVGDSPIVNISVASSRPEFEVSPTQIQILEPENNEAEPSALSAIVPVLRVSALHGISTDGLGFIDVMPMGYNEAEIMIEGTTTDSDGDSKSVGFIAQVSVDALVIDVRVFSGNQELSLDDVIDHIPIIYDNIAAPTPLWEVYTDSITIINYGNVSVEVTEYSGFTLELAVFRETTLGPGQSLGGIIPILIDNNVQRFTQLVIRICGNRTVADYKKMVMGDDGCAHLWLVHNILR